MFSPRKFPLLLALFCALALLLAAAAPLAAAPSALRVLPPSPVLVKLRACDNFAPARSCTPSAKMSGGLAEARSLSLALAQPLPVEGWPDWFILGSDGVVSAQALASELATLAVFEVVEPLGFASVDQQPTPTPQASSWTDGTNPTPNDPLLPAYTPNDPLYPQEYAHTKMQVAAAHDTTRGAGVIIAVLDSGVDLTHPDLQGRLTDAGRDFVSGHANAQDDHGHGTHVTGIIVATAGNGLGVAGVAPLARVMPLKVLAQNGSGDFGAIASGIRYAADNGAFIINMSLGGQCTGSALLTEAVNYARAKGLLVIAAAGNSATSAPTCPAALDGVLGIGSTDQNDMRSSFSNYGQPNADVAAPGSNVVSTMLRTPAAIWNASGYGQASGTSMAAPNAAGVAALVKAAFPSISGSAVAERLAATADSIGNQQIGPRLNARNAVGGAAPAPTSPAPTAPPPTLAPGNCASGSYADQLVCRINSYRAGLGLTALRYDGRLAAAGDFHNRWMRDHNCFSHNCPGEDPVLTRMRNAGYPVVTGGENIGKGYTDPAAMFEGWRGSSGHDAAMRNTVWPDIGCAYLLGPSAQPWDSYWSCEFARGNETSPPTATLPRTATPARSATPVRTATPRPPATATLRPVRSATPQPTVPPPTGGPVRYAFVRASAVNRAQQLAAELCASGFPGVRCTAGQGTTSGFLDIRLDTRLAPLAARTRMESLCSGYLGGVVCTTRPT